MTLLITVIAAIIATIAWYVNESRDTYKLGTLSLMYWGASLMWFIDFVAEYIELRADYSMTGGVYKLSAKKGNEIIYEQFFNFILKPSVKEIQKVLEAAGIEDWRKYYTDC